MEKPTSFGLVRAKSDQLVEAVAAAFKSSPTASSEGVGAAEGGGAASRKSGKRMLPPISPARGNSSNGKNTHIRKSRSAQIMKLDMEELSSGAALSRASSASLGLSFSFTGFTVPPEDIVDSTPFSDDDETPEDLEAGAKKGKFQTEPTLPIFLKEGDLEIGIEIYSTNRKQG